MVKKCIVPYCRSGLDPEKVTLFRAPRDRQRLEEWRKFMPLSIKGHILIPQHHVCSKHFERKYIITHFHSEAKDTGIVYLHIKRRWPKLTPDAVPTIFPRKLRKRKKKSGPDDRVFTHLKSKKRKVSRKISDELTSENPDSDVIPPCKEETFEYLWDNKESLQLPNSNWARMSAEDGDLHSAFSSENVLMPRKQVCWDNRQGVNLFVYNKPVELPSIDESDETVSSDILPRAEYLLRAINDQPTCAGGPPGQEYPGITEILDSSGNSLDFTKIKLEPSACAVENNQIYQLEHDTLDLKGILVAKKESPTEEITIEYSDQPEQLLGLPSSVKNDFEPISSESPSSSASATTKSDRVKPV